MNLRCTLAALVLGMSVSQAQAQIFDDMLTTVSDSISDITDAVLPGVTNIRVGLGPSIGPEYEGSDDYNVGIKPLISFNYRDLIQVDNNNLRVNILGSDSLFPSKNFKAGPLLKIDFGRNENDSPDLTGLGDVDTSIELGIFAS